LHLNSGIRRHVKLPACSTQHLHMHIDRPNEQMAHCARHTANRGERHNTSTDPCRGYYATRTRRPSIRGTRPRVSTVPCGGDKREVNEPAARVAQSPKLAWSGWSACLGEATACNYDARAAGGWPSYSGQVSTTNQTTSKGTARPPRVRPQLHFGSLDQPRPTPLHFPMVTCRQSVYLLIFAAGLISSGTGLIYIPCQDGRGGATARIYVVISLLPLMAPAGRPASGLTVQVKP
jgi:hypothetical protein